MKLNCYLITSIFCLVLLNASAVFSADKANVLIRVDDVGMSHSVNLAVQDFIKTGVPFNASIMVPCPWFSEAVEMLKGQQHVAIGLHITLTSEFKQYRWGPVAGAPNVTSLVGSDGYFLPSVREFLLSNYSLKDIETEIRAQVQKAFDAGLEVTYLDHHMGIARSTPEIAAVLEKVAEDFGLVVSRYYREVPDDLFHYAINDKKSALLEKTKNLKAGQLNMFIMHPGRDNPELQVMIDMNSYAMMDLTTGESVMSKHRHAELGALTDEAFVTEVKKHNVLTYKDLISTYGVEGQTRGGILYGSKKESVEIATRLSIEAEEVAKSLRR